VAPSDRLTRDHLAQAELHLAQAVDRLARQEELAARVPRGSPHAAIAGELLATMRRTLALMVAHRATILRELGGAAPLPGPPRAP
jgi:poly-gamma-glutamate capsule biosynthesis protein CapA/YwtB (metallophosphatase superfamily)